MRKQFNRSLSEFGLIQVLKARRAALMDFTRAFTGCVLCLSWRPPMGTWEEDGMRPWSVWPPP